VVFYCDLVIGTDGRRNFDCNIFYMSILNLQGFGNISRIGQFKLFRIMDYALYLI
jgi:hypothetical protein